MRPKLPRTRVSRDFYGCRLLKWITSGFAVTRAKFVKALMFACSSMIDGTTGAIILA
jgi:hypothetical protein